MFLAIWGIAAAATAVGFVATSGKELSEKEKETLRRADELDRKLLGGVPPKTAADRWLEGQ